MSVDPQKYAGQKVACSSCGQRYRLPSGAGGGVTPVPGDAPVEPRAAGIVPLGHKLSVLWILLSTLIMLVITIGGIYGGKMGVKALVDRHEIQKYGVYIIGFIMWAPTLAFVISGWITARFSPGRTIAEPALAAALTVAVLTGLVLFRPGPVDTFLGAARLDLLDLPVPIGLKANVFALAMFNAAMLSLAGAYFGEVAQEKATAKG